jgi:hypothetical protein
MRLHKSLTADRITEAVERNMTTLDNPGFCIACGEEAEGCEPDARNYECECCGKATGVRGARVIVHDLIFITHPTASPACGRR